MILYVYNDYKGNRNGKPNTEQLILLALKQYADETGAILPVEKNGYPICRTQKGKPYIEGLPIHFSVSHSDQMWVCLVGESESGIDIQYKVHSNFEAISRRFFQLEEQHAVNKGGINAFIAIWCRKEAFIKYYGLTIGETIDWLNVAKDDTPAQEIEHMGKQIFFRDIDVHPDFLCVAATDLKEDIWIRKILVE